MFSASRKLCMMLLLLMLLLLLLMMMMMMMMMTMKMIVRKKDIKSLTGIYIKKRREYGDAPTLDGHYSRKLHLTHIPQRVNSTSFCWLFLYIWFALCFTTRDKFCLMMRIWVSSMLKTESLHQNATFRSVCDPACGTYHGLCSISYTKTSKISHILQV